MKSSRPAQHQAIKVDRGLKMRQAILQERTLHVEQAALVLNFLSPSNLVRLLHPLPHNQILAGSNRRIFLKTRSTFKIFFFNTTEVLTAILISGFEFFFNSKLLLRQNRGHKRQISGCQGPRGRDWLQRGLEGPCGVMEMLCPAFDRTHRVVHLRLVRSYGMYVHHTSIKLKNIVYI